MPSFTYAKFHLPQKWEIGTQKLDSEIGTSVHFLPQCTEVIKWGKNLRHLNVHLAS